MKIWTTVWLLVGGMAIALGAPQQYLPIAGPNPLRFRPAAPASLPRTVVPLPTPQIVAQPEPEPEPEPEFQPDSLQPAAVGGTSAPEGRATLPPEPPAPEAMAPAQSVETGPPLTPQMLLHYFHDQGGANEAVVALPVLFTPPLPAGAEVSSRVTYTTPPGPVRGPGSPPASPR